MCVVFKENKLNICAETLFLILHKNVHRCSLSAQRRASIPRALECIEGGRSSLILWLFLTVPHVQV